MSAFSGAHDIDASGGAISVNDAIIINRYLAGFRGNTLTQGLSLAGTRTNPTDIQTYLASGCPTTAGNATTTTTFIHPNVTGSPIMATNGNGDPAWFENYSAFGERIKNEPSSNIGSNNNQNWFIGKPVDSATGLVYFGARWYDPEVARFLSFDPAPVNPDSPHSFNCYAYGNNNPYKYLDPDGREPARVESSAFMLAVMPGQGHFDTARNAFANEQYGKAAVFTAAMLIEQAMAVATLGESIAGRTALNSAATAAKIESASSLKAESASSGVTASQQQNIDRFSGKLPANAKDTVNVRSLPNDGVAAQGTSAGRVPGSSAVYEKQIDAAGKTSQYTKTTYDPKGNIVNVKDKISGETFTPSP